jgi:nicotinate-nucleotide pyrophosphorylase (carboxylating)
MQLEEIIKSALREDVGTGDITRDATVGKDVVGSAKIISRQQGTVAGLEVAKKTFRFIDAELEVKLIHSDGDPVKSGDELMTLKGRLSPILTAERVALNFLGKLSGIATLTRSFVEQVRDTGCVILDTRKTTPLLRDLEKYAVRMGGGQNHRSGLHDMYLIKENHIAAAGSIDSALKKVFTHREKEQSRTLVEIEVTSLDELRAVLRYRVDRVLLDNMSVEEIKEAVRVCNHRTKLEVSGGINMNNVREYAETGVDFISIGQITHSAPALDMSLLIDNNSI